LVLGQKHISPNFSAITVAKIQAKTDNASFVYSFENKLGQTTCLQQRQQKK